MSYEHLEAVIDEQTFLDDQQSSPTSGLLGFGVDKSGKVQPSKHNVSGAQVHALAENEIDLPSPGTPNARNLFWSYLTDGNGSKAHNINGLVTPQTFEISAHATKDIYIHRLVIQVADSGITLGKFGQLSNNNAGTGWSLALTGANPIQFVLDAQTLGDVIIQSSVFSPWGRGGTLNEIVNYSGTLDCSTITLDFFQVSKHGLRIGAGNSDKIVSTVKGKFNGLSFMTVLAQGEILG